MKKLILSLTMMISANIALAQSQGDTLFVGEAREMLNEAYGTSNFIEIARGMLQKSYGKSPSQTTLEEYAKTCKDDSKAGLFCWFVPCSDVTEKVQTLKDNNYLVLAVDSSPASDAFCEVRYSRSQNP